ncbi:MAG: DUF4431 domain-containing protein [Lysobacter sp.]|nr:DUF4431 domain-containing protein [Lysobacter sp.]
MRLVSVLCAALLLPACGPGEQTLQPEACLPYGPRSVTLSGKAVTRMFPGPPDSRNVDSGSAAENALLLQLDAPICVASTTGTDSNAVEEREIREIQLVPQSSFAAAYSLSGRRVTATGPLFHAQNDHHRTKVLMTLRAIAPN